MEIRKAKKLGKTLFSDFLAFFEKIKKADRESELLFL